MKNVAVVEMPHGVTLEALPTEVQSVLQSWGVEAVPSVMAGSEPVNGKCLILLLVSNAVTVQDFEALALAGVALVGLYSQDLIPVVPMNAAVYDKYISPLRVVDESGAVVSTTQNVSLAITHVFSGMAVPASGTWPTEAPNLDLPA